MTQFAIRGYPVSQSITLDTVVGGVNFAVYDCNNAFIVGGASVQNPNLPTEHNAVFTIPKTAYVGNDGSKYWIEWTAGDTIVRDSFIVFPSGEPLPKSIISITMHGKQLSSQIALPFEAQSIQASLYTTAGQLLEVAVYDTALPPDVVGQSFRYAVQFMSRADGSVALGRPYVVLWEYTTLAGSGTDVYQIYVPHFRELKWLNDARVYLDMLRNDDILAQLRVTTENLIPFVAIGLDRVNGTGTGTNWNIINFPTQLEYALQMCIRHEWLNARYIAEGLSAFEFQGASTQLSVDRKEVFQVKMDEIGGWLNENLEKQKNLVIRAGSPGAIAMTRNPTLNWSPLTRQMSNWFSGMGTRAIMGF